MGALQEKTDEIVENLKSNAPPEVLQTWMQGVGKVEALGLAERAPAVGAEAPDFSRPSLEGGEISLRSLREQGPVILKFIRGSWCPFCSVEFAMWKNTAGEFGKHGARVVFVTPEKGETAADAFKGAPFDVVLDKDHSLAASYGVNFELPDELLAVHNGFDLAPEKINDDGQAQLPSPAVFVIQPNGQVGWRFIEGNYTKRAEPTDVLKYLQA